MTSMWVIVSPLCFHPLLILWFSVVVSGSFPDLNGGLLGSGLLVLGHVHIRMFVGISPGSGIAVTPHQLPSKQVRLVCLHMLSCV